MAAAVVSDGTCPVNVSHMPSLHVSERDSLMYRATPMPPLGKAPITEANLKSVKKNSWKNAAA